MEHTELDTMAYQDATNYSTTANREKADTPRLPLDSSRIAAYFKYKAYLDRPIAFVLLIVSAPVIFALMALIRLTSRGPAIYRQVRTGKGQREFRMYKLRTMRFDAEKRTGPIWSTVDDPRITVVGHFLRLLHLDELPQLWNVVRGDMGFIGPRPERPEIIERLLEDIPNFNERHVVIPGITGLAQVNLPSDTHVDGVHEKLHLDLLYIRTNNIWLEMRIAACTCLRMCGLRGGRAVWLFGLERVPAKPRVHRYDAGHSAVDGLQSDDADRRLPKDSVSAAADVLTNVGPSLSARAR